MGGRKQMRYILAKCIDSAYKSGGGALSIYRFLCMNAVKAFQDAVNNIYPQTQIPLCMIHVVHDSMKYG